MIFTRVTLNESFDGIEFQPSKEIDIWEGSDGRPRIAVWNHRKSNRRFVLTIDELCDYAEWLKEEMKESFRDEPEKYIDWRDDHR